MRGDAREMRAWKKRPSAAGRLWEVRGDSRRCAGDARLEEEAVGCHLGDEQLRRRDHARRLLLERAQPRQQRAHLGEGEDKG